MFHGFCDGYRVGHLQFMDSITKVLETVTSGPRKGLGSIGDNEKNLVQVYQVAWNI